MDISSGLIAKAVGGTAAVVAASGTSLLYKDEIGSFLFGPHLSEEIVKANEKLDSLGIPHNCRFGAEWSFPVCDSLDENKLNAIKFEGKTESSTIPPLTDGANLSLKIEKLSETDFFNSGLKFIFSNEKDITIPASSQQISLKANTNTEFKIKTSDSSSSTLERAWDVTELAKKVGLTCPKTPTPGECSITNSDTINVYEEDKKKATNLTFNSSGGAGKIKFEENKEGYNQGFRFHVEEGNIGLTGTNSSVEKLKEFAAYEIKEHIEGSEKKWYLTRKAAAARKIKKILKLPEKCELPSGNNSKSCTINTKDDLKKINFENKGTSDFSVSNPFEVSLEMQKAAETDYPLGYKFIFKVTTGDVINIPETGSNQITINTTNTEFKIKKVNNNLTLEKKA